MKNLVYLYLLMIISFISCGQSEKKQSAAKGKPNIIMIYIDDLGYGDVGCYGATEVQTPNVDALAKGGFRFTDAHCSASTCTPSRYALLTGSYAFRSDAAILPGDAPLLINTDRQTIPSMLKKAGYRTGVVGKWHLGLGTGKPDWNSEVKPGPLEIGFDYSFLIPATQDRVPTVFLENHRVVGLDPNDPISVDYSRRFNGEPVGYENPQMLKIKADLQHSQAITNGISRIGYMTGGKKALWTDEDFSMILTAKANDFITQHKAQPFFLYFSFPNIHVPRTPNQKFVGATKMGSRGDAIAEMDWMVGETIKTLKKLGIENNTLIIFSSDNGPVLDDGYDDKAVQLLRKHRPAGIFKGGKYSAFEGGTRVPTIAYWPDQIEPGVSDALISQVDFFASLAKLTGTRIDDGKTAPDSQDLLSVLMGKSVNGRKEMVEEAFTMALRSGEWKYIKPVSKPTPEWLKNKAVATGLSKDPQLYNLSKDPSEQRNLADTHPEILKSLADKLDGILKTK
jgi:arylsulfatase A